MSESDFGDTTTVAQPAVDANAATLGYVLSVIEGPDAGRTFSLAASLPVRQLIGKGPACDMRLTDPSVSRRHVAVEVVGRRLRIQDLGSTNGTYAEGIQVTEAYLRGGEVVRIGATAFRVQEDVASEAPAIPNEHSFGD